MSIDVTKNLFEGKSPDEKLEVLDFLCDLIEEKYTWTKPDEAFTEAVVNSLVNAIVVEDSPDMQYDMLQTLYKWSWYPCEDKPYDVLLSSIERISEIPSLILVLRVLISSGNPKYMNTLKKYETSENKGLAEVSREGIELLSQG